MQRAPVRTAHLQGDFSPEVGNCVLLQAYNGKVRSDLDHDQLMPAAWRLEKYLDADDDEDIKLDSLRGHKLVYNKERPGDDMARRDDTDDLVVSHLRQVWLM